MRVAHIGPHLCQKHVHLRCLLQGVERVDAPVKREYRGSRLTSKMMGIAFNASPSQEVIWTSRSRTDQSPTTPVSRWSASVSDSM